MVLLELVARHYRALGARDCVHVCHLNHNQRPFEHTERDQQLVQELCRRHNLAITTQRLELQAGSSEASLRQARYDALAQVAHEQDLEYVLTAHHADDQLETYLFRLIRGAHPESLRGIPPCAVRRASTGLRFKVARPLLDYSKAQLLEFARNHQLNWNEDTTNAQSKFARNRIRNELVPLLDNLRPGTSKRLAYFFSTLEQNAPRSRNRRQIEKLCASLQSPHGGSVQEIDFASLKKAIDQLLMRSPGRTTRSHWENVKRQLQARQATRTGGGEAKQLQFPGGHALCFKGSRLYWTKVKNS